MTASNRFMLTMMVMLIAFLILAARATAFEVKGYSPAMADSGTYLVQSEGEAPTLCYSTSRAVKVLTEADPEVRIYVYVATADGSRALVAYFSNGSGAFMLVEANGLVCSSIPLSPYRAARVKRGSEAEGSGIVIIPRWPQQEE